MKNLKLNLVVMGMFLALAAPVKAMEGTASLGSVGGEMGSCFVASVYYEGRYRVLMTCRGLRSALDPIKNKYVAWAKKGENLNKLGEIVNGKMQASMTDDFERVEITVEESNNVKKPSGEALLSGNMEKIELDSGQARMTNWEEEATVTVLPTPTPEVKGTSSVGSVFKVVGKALLTGFLVLLGVVGILSYISRRGKN